MAIGRINATLSGVQPGGLAKIVPTSVAVGSGSGSVDSNGTITFSGASSISINSCFNSTYRNYKIIIRAKGDAGRQLVARVRSGSTDLTTTTYNFGGTFIGTTESQAFGADNNASFTSLNVGYCNTSSGIMEMLLTNVFEATTTEYISVGQGRYSTNYGGIVNNSTSYDGITFFPTAGNITGAFQIYGYN